MKKDYGYKALEKCDFVMYQTKDDNQIHSLDCTNKTVTTENTGNPWYKDAYGNCLIVLNNQERTDKLYLIKWNTRRKIEWNTDGFTKDTLTLLEREAVIVTRNGICQ